jgi:predicted RND superfamily exporter protein
MKKFFEAIISFPRLTILATLLLTVFFALQLKKVRLETDMSVYLPDDHPAIIYEELIGEIFNYQESLVIAIFNDGPDGIFNPQTLAKIKRMSEALAASRHVIAYRDEDVKSISTMDNIVGTEQGIDVVPLMEEVPTTAAELEQLKRNIYGNEMFVGWLVSDDGTAATIMAKVDDAHETQILAYREARQLIAREQGGGDRIYLAGNPALEATFVDYITANTKRMLPIIITVIIAMLYILFGSVRGVVLPLLVVLASAVWCMGFMGMLGIPAYDLTTLTPVILIAMGSANGIHILNRYYEEARKNSSCDRSEVVVETMLTIWPPIVMTSLTTAIGFGSLLTSRLVPIQCFGAFTGVGIMCALLFSLTFIPAGLMLVGLPRAARANGRGFIGLIRERIDAGLGAAGRGVYRYRLAICVFSALLAVIAALGFTRIRANDSWIEMFPHKSDIYISNELICDRLSGVPSLNIVVEGDEPDAIKSPTLLRKLSRLQDVAEELEPVGATISIADYVKRMNKVMNADSDEFNTIPATREAIAQYLLLYSISGDPDDFDEVVDYDYRQANMIVTLKDDFTAVVKQVADRLERQIDESFADEPVTVNLTGFSYVTAVVIDLAVGGMLSSIIISIFVIYIMTAIMFRSPTGGVYTAIPITMALLLNFGLMGAVGITIGFANSVTFAVAMGIGVDYAIHLVFKFQREVAKHENLGEVTSMTLKTSGKAILFNAAAVTAGFLVLLASSFTGHRIMGRLLSLSMVTSFLGSVTLLPATLCVFKPRFAFRQASAPAGVAEEITE